MKPLYGGQESAKKKTPKQQASEIAAKRREEQVSKARQQSREAGLQKRREAAMAPPIVKNEESTLAGAHLFADINHDFPKYRGPFYNIGGDLGYTPSQYSEDAMVKTIKDNAETFEIPNGRARLENTIVFTVPEKTATFQSWIPPKLSPIGNSKLGIVQDAGEKITNPLGAQNVLTFGSILDPAGKPIRTTDRPIWFKPTTNEGIVNLSVFGFDPNVIQGIKLKDLTAGTVKASFLLPTKEIDAVSMQVGKPTKPKPINQTKIELSGYFTSIAEASEVSDVKFYIGKTLGDTMLVASCMPVLPSLPEGAPVSNPFHPSSGNGMWEQWVPFEGEWVQPETLILKTGDRLNHIRAFMMNVGSILEQQVGGGRVVKQYEYIPGDVSEEAIHTSLDSGFEDLKVLSKERFRALATSFLGLLGETTGIKEGYSGFTGTDIIKTPEGRKRGEELLREIADKLQELSSRVDAYIDIKQSEGRGTTTIKDHTDVYNITTNVVERVTPSTINVFAKPGKTLDLHPKIVVSRGKGDDPLPSLNISLWNTFAKLDIANSDLRGTDIYRQFFDKLTTVAPSETSVVEEDKTQEYVNAIVGQTSGGKRGGVRQNPKVHDLALALLVEGVEQGSYPTIRLFFDYLHGLGVSDYDKIDYLTDVRVFAETNRIMDGVLAESVWEELDLLIETAAGDLIGLLEWKPAQVNDPSTPATIVFNAFTCSVNAENAIEPSLVERQTDEPVEAESTSPSELYDYFKYQEQLFLERVGEFTTTLRSGRQLMSPVKREVGPSEAREVAQILTKDLQRATGGLRTRRPLYSNARSTASRHVDGTSNNEGLRKRVRTRTRRRLRKSSRSTRRR